MRDVVEVKAGDRQGLQVLHAAGFRVTVHRGMVGVEGQRHERLETLGLVLQVPQAT